jgi:hypothetical protein
LQIYTSSEPQKQVLKHKYEGESKGFPSEIVYGKNACCKLTAAVESYKYHTKIRNQSNGTAPVTETAAVPKDSFDQARKKQQQ